MKITSLIFVLSILISSCATTAKKENITYIEKPKIDCIRVGDLTATGFSLIPPLASSIAKSMLEEKAAEYNVNSIRLDKETGTFQVELQATGYRCSDVAKVSNKKIK